MPSGKILVASVNSINGATRNYLIRLNANGSEDNTFNIGDGFNDYPLTMILTSDNKVLIGGYFISYKGNTRNRLVLVDQDGVEDSAFYTNLGTAFEGGSSQLFDLKEQSNNKILVGGMFSAFNGNSALKGLVRLNSDGTQDTSFNNNLNFSQVVSVGFIGVQSNKLIIGGTFIWGDEQNLIRLT